MPRKKRNSQQKFRVTEFKHDQYWQISYTERYSNKLEKDFKTIIKAKSYVFAKHILELRVEEDDPSIKIKSVQGYMYHKDYTMSPRRKSLGIKEWEQIHASCFPNENNHLFKVEIPRPSWKTNRFNGSGKNNKDHIKKIGFKKGKENWAYKNLKGKTLSEDRKTNMLYHGKWVEWSEESREEKKNEIITALNKAGNIRWKASEILGFKDRNYLYKWFKKFPEIDWQNEYPAPPPPGPPQASKEESSRRGKKGWETMKKSGTTPFGGKSFSPEANSKRAESLKNRATKIRIKKFKKLEPQIRKALSNCDNSRKEAAKLLNIPYATLSKYMHQMKKELGINWSKEYPNKNANPKYSQ